METLSTHTTLLLANTQKVHAEENIPKEVRYIVIRTKAYNKYIKYYVTYYI